MCARQTTWAYPVILEYQPPNTFRSIGQQDTPGQNSNYCTVQSNWHYMLPYLSNSRRRPNDGNTRQLRQADPGGRRTERTVDRERRRERAGEHQQLFRSYVWQGGGMPIITYALPLATYHRARPSPRRQQCTRMNTHTHTHSLIYTHIET